MQSIFPLTAARVEEWSRRAEVLGVLLVGSKSRGHADALSDDDLEVLLTDEAHARLSPSECIEWHAEGEGATRRLIYDAQYAPLSELERKVESPRDLDHWPYERAGVLFDRDGRTRAAVEAAARMAGEFRRARLRHAYIDAWVAARRAEKTTKRGMEAASHLLVARGAKALSRLLFALEWRWVPLDHWLEPELNSLSDESRAGEHLMEALVNGRQEPLLHALDSLEDRLAAEGLPRADKRAELFFELIHPARAEERAVHGLN
ncbi:MAG TPA: hypothetical protein VGV59_05640 [Pyrinomonadaceae bacterium]|nr:hypothetical protein [Pyrinomonadaceae bacterium]